MKTTSGKTIFLIEDERDVVDLLAQGGFAMKTATEGAAGTAESVQ